MDDAPVFRASKKRKFARSRLDNESESTETADIGHENGLIRDQRASDDDGANLSNLLKLRNHARSRNTGVQFSNLKTPGSVENGDELAVARMDPDQERLRSITSRFVGSSGGQITDVDKHMMAYIDSEMVRRRERSLPAISPDEIPEQNLAFPTTRTISNSNEQQQQPAIPVATTKQGNIRSAAQAPQHLAEVDLGPSATNINLARTSAALARAKAGETAISTQEEAEKPRRPRKPRLGRDGKPFRPRPRKRRNSEDVARDALVEQVLHEHRLDVYDEAEPGGRKAGPGAESDKLNRDAVTHRTNDEDADERLAEEFRQQFLDAMAERQSRHHKAAPSTSQAKGVATGSAAQAGGPKLGGSRSARAKMAALQAQEQKGSGRT